jgi:hypothetical protein
MPLAKSYHHYEGSTCTARYPLKANSEGVWIMGPIRVVKDKDCNIVFEDRKVLRDGQPATESVPKWDESQKDEVCAGPFDTAQEAINALRKKLAPKPRALPKAKGSDGFAKFKDRHGLGSEEAAE